jgi:hypothetical protein
MAKQGEYAYDLFISYAEADRARAEGCLLGALTGMEWQQHCPGQAYRKTCAQWPLQEE